jgi:hypothetical protein
MLTVRRSLMFLLFAFFSNLNATYYCEQATMAHLDRISLFCYMQNTHVENLRTYLQGDESMWTYVIVELETEKIRGIAIGTTHPYSKETSIVSIFSDAPQAGLTEYLLHYIFTALDEKKIKSCGLPAQEIYRGGMRTINTNIEDFLKKFKTTELRYVLYPASRFEQPDEEALNVLRTYAHMLYRFYKGAPFFYNGGYKKLDLETIDARIPGMIKTYSRPKSALLVAYLKEVMIAAAAITPLESISPVEDDVEYVNPIINMINKDERVACEKLLRCAYLTNVLVDEGFRHLGIRTTLDQKLAEFAKQAGYSGFSYVVDKPTWHPEVTEKHGFKAGPFLTTDWPTNMPDGSVQNAPHSLQHLYQYFE